MPRKPRTTTIKESNERLEYALILESNEKLIWYSYQRNETVPQTRLYFEKLLIGWDPTQPEPVLATAAFGDKLLASPKPGSGAKGRHGVADQRDSQVLNSRRGSSRAEGALLATPSAKRTHAGRKSGTDEVESPRTSATPMSMRSRRTRESSGGPSTTNKRRRSPDGM